MSLGGKRRRSQCGKFDLDKLQNVFVLLWFNKTNTYSEVLSISNSLFSKFSAAEKVKWTTGSSFCVKESGKNVLCSILKKGSMVQVTKFSEFLNKSIVDYGSGFDTENAIELACNTDNADVDSDSSPGADSSDDSGSALAAAEARILKTTATARTSITITVSNPQQPSLTSPLSALQANEQSDRLRRHAIEMAKLASFSAAAATADDSAATVDASAEYQFSTMGAAATSYQIVDLPVQFQESPATPSRTRTSMPALTAQTVPTKMNSQPSQPLTTAQGDNIIRLLQQIKSILVDVRENTRPATVDEETLRLFDHLGREFCTAEVNGSSPTQFALNLVDRLMGPDYIASHRFEQYPVPAGCLAASAELIQQVKDALRNRYGSSAHWVQARLSLNQASRDRAKKMKGN